MPINHKKEDRVKSNKGRGHKVTRAHQSVSTTKACGTWRHRVAWFSRENSEKNKGKEIPNWLTFRGKYFTNRGNIKGQRSQLICCSALPSMKSGPYIPRSSAKRSSTIRGRIGTVEDEATLFSPSLSAPLNTPNASVSLREWKEKLHTESKREREPCLEVLLVVVLLRRERLGVKTIHMSVQISLSLSLDPIVSFCDFVFLFFFIDIYIFFCNLGFCREARDSSGWHGQFDGVALHYPWQACCKLSSSSASSSASVSEP